MRLPSSIFLLKSDCGSITLSMLDSNLSKKPIVPSKAGLRLSIRTKPTSVNLEDNISICPCKDVTCLSATA